MTKRLAILLFVGCFGLPTLGYAAEFKVAEVILAASQQADITVANAVGTMWFTLPANSLNPARSVRVKLAKVTDSKYYSGEQQPISDVYRYTMIANKPIKLNRTVSVKLAYPAQYASTSKVMKFYNEKTGKWKKMSNQDDVSSALQATGEIQKKHAIIALFEKPLPKNPVYEGVASYYNWHGAASNDFPMGTRIRVTNVDTGAYVDVTVVSTGPFVPGRIVDLPREDFAKIASLSAGVVRVTVQAIE